MQIGMIGLGRMGANMARRLMKGGHKVVAYDINREAVEAISGEGAEGAETLLDMTTRLAPTRIIWVMAPAGKPVEDTVAKLSRSLSPGDIIIDGGNSHYSDDIARYDKLSGAGIHFLDAGVSGGVWGLKEGYCLMIGGLEDVFRHVEPIFKTLAPPNGYMYCGPVGAGHYVKMVHNGIEYALMEAYGEGFELLKASRYGDKLNLANVANLWNQGSVIRSWLLELLESALDADPELDSIRGYVPDSGEGRWTVEEAIHSGVAATSIAHSLFKRFQSRQADVFSDKIIAALRREFGGHAVKDKGEKIESAKAGAGGIKPAEADD